MGAALDLTGHRYGRLLVDNFSFRNEKNGMGYWNCLCDCDERSIVTLGNLRSGHTTSCGCIQQESRISHGKSKEPLYKAWIKMHSRCNPANLEYESEYWGRGICVCDVWKSFDVFDLDMGSDYSDGLILDRIDPNGNYESANCQWVTPAVSSFNQRISKDNKSGCSGVHWRADRKCWESRIAKDNTKTSLGKFYRKEDAIRARLEAEIKIYGEYKEKNIDTLNSLLQFAGITNHNERNNYT